MSAYKSKPVAVSLAIFLGAFGAHKFYLGNSRTGLLYLLFSWTGITFWIALFDAVNIAISRSSHFSNQNQTTQKANQSYSVQTAPSVLGVGFPFPAKFDFNGPSFAGFSPAIKTLDQLNPRPKSTGGGPPQITERLEEIEKLWGLFLNYREIIEPFRRKFEELEAESDSKDFPHYHFNADVKLPYRGKNFTISHGRSKLDDGLLHKSDCRKLDRENHANGWEYRFIGDIKSLCHAAALELISKSPLLVEVIQEKQGLWRTYIDYSFGGSLGETTIKRGDLPPHLTQESYDLLWRTRLLDFELLLPGFVGNLVAAVKKRGIKLTREREYQLLGSGRRGVETQRVDDFTFLSELEKQLTQTINDLRPVCLHFDTVSCILCGEEAEPNLLQNLTFNLPNEICAWCLKLLDYHELPIKYAGKPKSEIREEAVSAFKLAVEYFDFQYWKTPVVTKNLLVSLDLKSKDPNQLRFAAAILASMPRDLMGFESDRHFFAATGLEHLLPKDKSRGKKSISRCGHLCLSSGERDICEFLFQEGIQHSREPEYQRLTGKAELTEFGFMRGDFLVGNTVVEFAGMQGNSEYDEKMKKKIDLCLKYEINLLVISPTDMKNLRAKFDGIQKSQQSKPE